MLAQRVTSRPWVTLSAASLSYFVVIYNTTAVNVAVSDISRDFGYSASATTWFINGYVLVLAMFLVLGGRLGDMFGRKRIWTIGASGVAISAVLLALTPDGALAIGIRALMGLSTALMAP
ncbi:MAG: MFS transporter, partial [Actinobacteria bacterium]|nr:MFS transporter [Actinomycetota bacterium]